MFGAMRPGLLRLKDATPEVPVTAHDHFVMAGIVEGALGRAVLG